MMIFYLYVQNLQSAASAIMAMVVAKYNDKILH